MDSMQFNTKLLTKLHAERLVPIRLSTAKMKITMSSMHLITSLLQQQKQCYTIRATT